jgi:hypothetical protein
MFMTNDYRTRLISLFRRNLILDMPAIIRAFPNRSRCSIFRDMIAVGYLSSYNHAGRFYTLTDVPQFDADGIWKHQDVFFSRHGTLKATVRHLIQTADAGKTHPELQQHLCVRIHNTLLDLVQQNEIARKKVGKLFVYVHIDPDVQVNQIVKRQEQIEYQTPAIPLGHFETIEVLLDVIHHGQRQPEQVFSHLRDKGLGITFEQVVAVFNCYGLGKKNSPSRH